MGDNKPREVLIIKTGYSEVLDKQNNSRRVSLGDIFRTTVLLPMFKEDIVTWVSDEYSFPLLENNQYINRLLPLDWLTAQHLVKERFDVLINLEKTPGICALAENIFAVNRYGFIFDPPTKKANIHGKKMDVLAVSSEPQLKRENQRTFQEMLYELVDSKWKGEGYVLGYKPSTTEEFDVGLNTNVGEKWPTKAWHKKNWDELEEKLVRNNIKTSRQDKQGEKILNNLYSYMDWLNSCKMIVSCDTLGLHIGLAMRKKVLCLFGATSEKEVYFYNLGEAITPAHTYDCMPCFEPECKKERSCMDNISVERVYKKIEEYLKK